MNSQNDSFVYSLEFARSLSVFITSYFYVVDITKDISQSVADDPSGQSGHSSEVHLLHFTRNLNNCAVLVVAQS